MPPERKKIRSAFTLLELLIVVSVIGLISSIVAVSYGNIRSNERDVHRLADVKKIAAALERYRNAKGAFPACNYNPVVCDYSANKAVWFSCLEKELKPFLGNIPVDPWRKPGIGYCYKTVVKESGNQISLIYSLENTNPNITDAGELINPRNSYGMAEYEITLQSYRD